ncbi:MAG: hypothetical protein JW830_08905 [Bacteroidales bacterium]|nr:hypothetical protein [Bacteroidales bacterium]
MVFLKGIKKSSLQFHPLLIRGSRISLSLEMIDCQVIYINTFQRVGEKRRKVSCSPNKG